MTKALPIDIFDELYGENSCQIDLTKLAKTLNITQAELAQALGLDRTAISKNPLLSPHEKKSEKVDGRFQPYG